jgi:hypothetical protein
MRIGGMFTVEPIGNIKNSYLQSLGDDTLLCMSGRCALYAVLTDLAMHRPPQTEEKPVAYLPAYTCETVLDSYEKAGYSCRFYDLDPQQMRPVFREEELAGVSTLALCGYFGFARYDGSFVKACRDRRIAIVHDTTHSPLFVDPLADYAAGSLRKWMGIACGGVAVKRMGKFSVEALQPDKEHLAGRYEAMELHRLALETGDRMYDEQAADVFWNTELRLRKMFDAFASDERSERIVRTFDFEEMASRRRLNFETLLGHLAPSSRYVPVFQELHPQDVPSHFTFYAEDRESLRSDLAACGVASTVYWPVPPHLKRIERYERYFPGASYIYGHVCSIQLDQRYGTDDMLFLADVLNSL